MNNRLYRSPTDRVLAGVAGGMAETWDLDPALVRLGWALLIILSAGTFLLVYIVMALAVPLRSIAWTPAQAAAAPTGSAVPPPGPAEWNDPAAPPPPNDYWSRPRRRANDPTAALVFGVLLVIVGGWLLLGQFMPLFDFGNYFWPMLLVLLGAVLVATAFRRRAA